MVCTTVQYFVEMAKNGCRDMVTLNFW